MAKRLLKRFYYFTGKGLLFVAPLAIMLGLASRTQYNVSNPFSTPIAHADIPSPQDGGDQVGDCPTGGDCN